MSTLGGERKIATMLFADLVGSTELAAGSDPEELRGRLEPFFEAARSALEQYGGTVEKYIGDAVMAVFGAPVAHGDDPDRAVAAGLAVAERVAQLDGQLAVRVGIETGEVLALPRAGDLTVTGEAVNAAARLQQAAEPGEVLVGERAARACRRAQLQPNGAVDAKGLDRPLTAFRAVEVCDEADISSVPLVGRDDDLQMLRLIARRAARERIPQLVTVLGEAGIGKTRLAAELFGELRENGEWRTIVGRSPPYGHGISFWALGEILRDAAGLSTDATADDVEAALRSFLTELGADDGTHLAASLTVAIRGEDDRDSANLVGPWRRFVTLLAADRPLAIGIDDAHWSDEATLELVEEAAFGLQDAPILIVCTSRPELTERRPDFGQAARNNTQLELLPLDAGASQQLAEMLLPAEKRRIAARIAEAAGGNPFFTEEVSRAVGQEAERADARLPDTVQAAIAARMDQLPVGEKRALQYASVLGHTFSQGPLGDLLGEQPADLLWGLRRKALVAERPSSEYGHYVFRHQLIRDVAYSSLPRTERARLHEQAAAALRARDFFAELPELVAYHLSRAVELEPTPERRTAARAALIEAADAAVRRGAAVRSQELYEEAAEVSATDPERAEPLRTAAAVALRAWRGDQAIRLCREAGEAWERADERTKAAGAYARAVEIGTRMHGISGDPTPESLAPLLQRGFKLVADDDLEVQTRLRLDESWLAWQEFDPDHMEKAARSGLELARESDDLLLMQNALDAVTASEWLQGRQRSALTYTEERLRLLESAPSTHAMDVEVGDALHMMVLCHVHIGEYRRALEFAIEASGFDRDRGVEHAAFNREVLPAFYLGEWDRMLEMSIQSRQAWVEAGRPPLGAFATSAACTAAVYGYRGQDDEAADWMHHAQGLTPPKSEHSSGVAMMRADLALHQGRIEDAVAATASPFAGTQWQAPYLAIRAEAFVRAKRPDAGEAIQACESRVGEDPHSRGVLLRARALLSGDDRPLREALALFRQIECPYQEARTGCLLGGDEREEGRRQLERLGATAPAD
jgi:class 3 adenylate cyclase